MIDANGPWAPVHEWVLDLDLTCIDLRVLIALSLFQGGNDYAHPSIAALADRARASKGSTKRSLARLRELGVIQSERQTKSRGGGDWVTGCRYWVLAQVGGGNDPATTWSQDGYHPVSSSLPPGLRTDTTRSHPRYHLVSSAETTNKEEEHLHRPEKKTTDTDHAALTRDGQAASPAPAPSLDHDQPALPPAPSPPAPRPKRQPAPKRINGQPVSADHHETAVQGVYNGWVDTLAGATRTLTPNRRRVIEKALAEFTVADVFDAAVGWTKDDWPDRAKHNDLTVLLRDPERIEKFRDLYRATQQTTPVIRNGSGLYRPEAAGNPIWARPDQTKF